MKSPKLPALAFIVVVSCSALSQEAIPASGTLSAESPATSISSMALSTDRLIELLREKPELLIEVKKLAAERLQAQGVDVQENSITDEKLFRKTATDSGLRSSLTLWLPARGHVSDTDLQQSKSTTPDSAEEAGPEYRSTRTRAMTLLKQVLGWTPQVSLEKGLEKTYAWIESEVRAKCARQEPRVVAGVAG